MEATNTVIANKDILDLVIPCESCDRQMELTRDCLECIALKHREKQAEITWDKAFKAGEKEAMLRLQSHVLGVEEFVDYSQEGMAKFRLMINAIFRR